MGWCYFYVGVDPSRAGPHSWQTMGYPQHCRLSGIRIGRMGPAAENEKGKDRPSSAIDPRALGPKLGEPQYPT
jgi:hypothetical protein